MRRTWLLFSQAVTIALAVLFVLGTLKPQWLGGGRPAQPRPTLSVAASPPDAVASGASGGYSAAARLAAPAVVSIVTNQAPKSNPHAARASSGIDAVSGK